MGVIYKFSHDGKQLVQTIGTTKVTGADGTHFNRPTFLAWLPDSTMFVADGYNGTRVAKFDKNGKFLLDWGKNGTPPREKRPGYMNNVHGIAVDPQTRRVFVNDRGNQRIQVFDENGKYLNEWSMGEDPSDIHLLYMGADRTLWAADRGTSKMLQVRSGGALSCIPGASVAIFPAASGACTASAWIRKATSMSPKWIAAGCRNSARVPTQTGRVS